MPRKPQTFGFRYNDAFPTRLRGLIDRDNLTQEELTAILNVKNRQSVTGYVDGSTLPTIDKLVSLAKFFNVSADYLLGLSNAAAYDTDLQAVCKYTGLSEQSIANIKKCQANKHLSSRLTILNDLLSDNNFLGFLYELSVIADIQAEAELFLGCDISALNPTEYDSAILQALNLKRELKYSVLEALEVFREVLNNIYGFESVIYRLQEKKDHLSVAEINHERQAAKERAAEVLEQITTGTLLEGVQDGEYKED